jgi:glycosyltransferase involved in cell wall biosynthesis
MSGKKKIIFAEYFSFIGGGQIVLLNLLKGLKKIYDVEVLLMKEGPFETLLKADKIKYTIIKAPEKPRYRYIFAYFKFAKTVYDYLKKTGAVLLYSNGFLSLKLTAIPAYFAGLKIIWHKHIIVDKKPLSYFGLNAAFLSVFVKKIICVSGAVMRSMGNAGVKNEKMAVIHNGMNPLMYSKAQRKKIRAKYGIKNEFVAGTVGFFRRNKGIELLIGAAEIAVKKSKNIKFLIAGKGERGDEGYEKYLRAKAGGKALKNNFIFAGYGDRKLFIPAFDVFVLPSPAEPFGMVTLEASSMGVPVAAFNTGGTPEIIKNGVNGYLVNEVSAEALAAKLLDVMKNKKQLTKTGRAAAKNVKENFTVKAQVDKTALLIQGVIDEQNRG